MKTAPTRTICFVIVTAVLLSFAACGKSGTQTAETPTVQPMQTNPAESLDTAVSTHRILIAYFTAAENSDVDAVSSASVVTVGGNAKGRVQALAEMIQSETGGDLFSIRTSTEYPGDGGKLIDFAADEQDANARPELTTHIENLDEYDVIFVGYPNYWGTMPMCVFTFLEHFDFSGKMILPFCTHEGSGMGRSEADIRRLCPGAKVEKGLAIHGAEVQRAKDKIASWVKKSV